MKYRKKPIIVEAFQWTPGMELPEWAHCCTEFTPYLFVSTLYGEMKANPDDYIIRGVEGEVYPCKPSIFEATYEPVSDDS